MAVYLLNSNDPETKTYSLDDGNDLDSKKKAEFGSVAQFNKASSDLQKFALDKWASEAEGGEVVKASVDIVKDITKFISNLTDRAEKSKDARIELVRDLAAGAKFETDKEKGKWKDELEEIRSAVGVGYNILEGWIEGMDAKLVAEVARRRELSKSN